MSRAGLGSLAILAGSLASCSTPILRCRSRTDSGFGATSLFLSIVLHVGKQLCRPRGVDQDLTPRGPYREVGSPSERPQCEVTDPTLNDLSHSLTKRRMLSQIHGGNGRDRHPNERYNRYGYRSEDETETDVVGKTADVPYSWAKEVFYDLVFIISNCVGTVRLGFRGFCVTRRQRRRECTAGGRLAAA